MRLAFIKFAVGVVGFLAAIAGINTHVPQSQKFGTTIPCPVSFYQDSLALPIGATDNSFTLVSGVDGNGNPLGSSNCNSGIYGFVIDEGTAIQEVVQGTASGTAITAVTRGIDTETGITSVSALEFAHRRGASVKITTSPWILVVHQILTGSGTLPSILQYATSITNASVTANNWNLVNYGTLASTSMSGEVAASRTNPGIVKIASGTDLANGVTTTTYELVAPAEAFSSSSKPSIVPVTNASGTLDPSFIGASTTYTVGGLNSASTTLNGTTTIPNATSSVLTTNASGILGGVQAGATGTVLMANNGVWTSSDFPRAFVSLNASTTSIGGATTSTLALLTLPPLTASTSLFVQFYISANGFQNVTSTFQIGGTNLFSCNGYPSGGGGSFWLTPQNANNSQFLTTAIDSDVLTGVCTTNPVGFEKFDFSTSTIWKIFVATPYGGYTLNGAMTVLAF